MIPRAWFGVLCATSWLPLTACTSRPQSAMPAGAVMPATAAMPAAEAVVTCESLKVPAPTLTGWAGIALRVEQWRNVQYRDLARVRVTLKDGAGERTMRGDVLAFDDIIRSQLPNCGVYPTRTRDTLHLTVHLDGDPMAAPAVAVETTLDLPLRPYWIWYASVRLGRRSSDPSSRGPHRSLAIPPRAGEVAGDSLYVYVSGRPLDRMILY